MRKPAGAKTMWIELHPKDPGIYWVSVEPKGREPRPWVVLKPVFQIMITPTGDVFELGTPKTEPTYNVSCLPEMGSPRVKYLLAVETVPTDPWPKAQQ